MLPVPVVEGVVKAVAAIRDVVQNHLLKAPPQRLRAKRYRTLVVWFL